MANFSDEEKDKLRTQMYAGFVTKDIPRFEMRGAGDGRRNRQTGYKQVTNYDAYNSDLLGRVKDAVGIKNVNNDDEIRRIYDYIDDFKASGAAPAPAPASPEPEPAVEKPIQLSTTAAKANAQAKAYEKTLMTRDGGNIFGTDPNVVADFNKLSANNYADEIKPKMPNELQAARSNSYAQNYANDYKLALSDQLESGTARLELKKNFYA